MNGTTIDNSFPYALLSSTVGAVVSLASVWILTAQSVVSPLIGA